MREEEVLGEIWKVIEDRGLHPRDSSYVSRILRDEKGVDKSLEKLGEESLEFILAVKNGIRDRTVSEGADLLFHFLVALYASGVPLEEVIEELAKRRK